MKIIEKLVHCLRSSLSYNSATQVLPSYIIWTDHVREWEPFIEKIKGSLPELYVLGEYNPDINQGPAIWLKYITHFHNIQHTPILYLPGVSKQYFRTTSPDFKHLKPLVEIQYRSVFWSQSSSKDWSLFSFLTSESTGVNLNFNSDKETIQSLNLSFGKILDMSISTLENKNLNSFNLDALILDKDLLRMILCWLDNPNEFINSLNSSEKNIFIKLCKFYFDFDPNSHEPISVIEKLASSTGKWIKVWEYYCETPTAYPNIPSKLRETCPTNLLNQYNWPQWNEDEENLLRNALKKLPFLPPDSAKVEIGKLYLEHKNRLSTVWNTLEETPLANALHWLNIVASNSQYSLFNDSLVDSIKRYKSHSWHVDNAVLKSLSSVKTVNDITAVKGVIRHIYLPWIDAGALKLQELASIQGYPYESSQENINYTEGTCIVFIDALRYDMAQYLASALKDRNFSVSTNDVWSALPSVTATAKPAITPVKNEICGNTITSDFEPQLISTGQSLKGGYQLRKLLKDNGWTILSNNYTRGDLKYGWLEISDIDKAGHTHGWKLVYYLDTLLNEILEKILHLVQSGWNKVHIVTDHGWLLIPDGLPKSELATELVDNKWGRCASIKTGAHTQEKLYPWYWNNDYYFALASGVRCYKSGEEFTHGGLSVQECFTTHITVEQISTST